MSDLEDQLEFQLKATKLKYQREFRPLPPRRWKCDFLIGEKLIVEVEGGSWTNGRHSRGSGFEKDCVKYNAITLAGFRILRVTGAHVRNGQALKWIDAALETA